MKGKEAAMNALEASFITNIRGIFQDNLLFAFICGSYAQGQATKKSDIDMFVCTSKAITDKQKADFLTFYYNMHESYGFTPDRVFPGELVQIKDLVGRIRLLKNKPLSLNITNSEYEDGIFWMAMLTDKKIALINEKPFVLDYFEKKAEIFQQQWKEQILELLPKDQREEAARHETKDLMRKYILFWGQQEKYKTVKQKEILFPRLLARRDMSKFPIAREVLTKD